ncbi:MAG: SIMPL domain-containing protein [Aestuariibacter sp.]
MVIKQLVLLITLSIGCCFATYAQQTIIVNGEANIAVTPDVLNFHVIIEEKGNLLTKLSKTLDTKSQKAIDELLDSGIPKQHIQSLNISVHPWYEREDNQQVQKGFVVFRQINVLLEDFTALDGLIDKILRVGVKSVGGFNHSVKNQQEVYQKALAKAVLNAKENAQAMVSVVHKKLGSVVSLQQISQHQSYPMRVGYAMAESQSPYSEGQMTVSASVQVEFLLQD